jgi:GWxTD domain-containing protein
MIEAVLFYHPASWWISHMIRTEREHCCDEIAVGFRGEVHTYATALTRLEQQRLKEDWIGPKLVLNAKGGSLMKRINRLLYPRRPVGLWAPVSAALVLAVSTAMALSAWHLKPLLEKSASSWQKWIDEDVVYIITNDERQAFEGLQSDDQRQRFVEQFWLRRDPTLGTPVNEYKEEHYRRIAYANGHWGNADQPGWRTDRGRIYIRYGPPDEIDSHPRGGRYERPPSEGGGSALTHPFEDWAYAHFEGVGRLNIEFVDVGQTGELRMTLDPQEKYKQP